MNTPLQQAAQAVIDRWDSPSWKDEPPTAVVIGALRKALADEQAQAANSRIASLYEELRKATDGGSESMTHDDALKQIAYWQDKEQAQAVEPMPTSIRRNRTEQEFKFGMEVLSWNRAQQTPPIDIGRELWVADEVLKLQALNEHPAPPAGERDPEAAFGNIEREVLIDYHRDLEQSIVTEWVKQKAKATADMLEADAKAQQVLSLDLLERLSKTLTKLGYSTPEGGMEHFGARIESQLYNLCRGVDSILAQQVAVPATDDHLCAMADRCTPNTETGSLNYLLYARAIEAHHGIGAKP